MNSFSSSPVEMSRSLRRNWELVSILTRRAVQERYRGSLFGMLWVIAQPLLMLLVYTLFFGSILHVRWSGKVEGTMNYALLFFAGLIPYNFLSECLNTAPMLILNNVSYVKKVVFPLEVLAFVSIGTALFQVMISTLVLLAFHYFATGLLYSSTLLLPIFYFPLILTALGISWGFAVLGAYFRDISHLTGLISMFFMFFAPVFYSLSTVGGTLRQLLFLNPMTPVIENMRAVIFETAQPDWGYFMLSLAEGVGVAWLGFTAFQLTRREFADGI